MKKYRIIFALVVVILFGNVPFFLVFPLNEAISLSSGLTSAIAAIITLIIALLLYSKYGVEKTFVRKQTETVFRLLVELKKINFILEGDQGHILFLPLDRLQSKHWLEYKERELLFSTGYNEGMNGILEIAEDIFLPSIILEKINPLLVWSISMAEKDGRTDRYFQISMSGHMSRSKDIFFGILNSKPVSLSEFVGLWRNVIDVSGKWLKEHSNTPINLNFEKS